MNAAYDMCVKLTEIETSVFIKAHNLDVFGPNPDGLYTVIDANKGPDVPLKTYKTYLMALKGAKRIAEKRCEPYPSTLTAGEIDDHPWVVYQPGPDEYYVRNLKTGHLSNAYPTYAKAEKRLRVLVCRAIGKWKAKHQAARY